MSWNELSLKDKADYIKESVNNGIYNLSDIRNRYNMYANGGYKPSESIKKRITNWEGSSMRTNRSFQAEANDFNRVIPSSIRSKLSQQQLDALYSYGYNVGMGKLKKRVLPTLTNYVQGKASNEDVQKSMWASKDNELRGLTTRRNVERSLFGGKYQTVFTGTGGTPHNYGYTAKSNINTNTNTKVNPYQLQNEEWQGKNYLGAYKGLQLSMNDIMGKTKEDDISDLFSTGTGPTISMENLLSIGNNNVAPVQPDYSYAKSLLSDFDSDLNSNMFGNGGEIPRTYQGDLSHLKDVGYQKWRANLPTNLREETPDYNLYEAYKSGAKPRLESDGYYHLPSRDPRTNKILKKAIHPTYGMALREDAMEGYLPVYKNGETYTYPLPWIKAEGGNLDNENTNLVYKDADNRRSNILLHIEDGNLYDSAGNNYTQSYLDEENVPIIKGIMPRNTKQYFDSDYTIKFLESAFAPVTNFAPSNVWGSLRESNNFNDFVKHYMLQDTSGFFTEEYAKEHPYISTLGNLGGDILAGAAFDKGIDLYRLGKQAFKEELPYLSTIAKSRLYSDNPIINTYATYARRFNLPDKARLPYLIRRWKPEEIQPIINNELQINGDRLGHTNFTWDRAVISHNKGKWDKGAQTLLINPRELIARNKGNWGSVEPMDMFTITDNGNGFRVPTKDVTIISGNLNTLADAANNNIRTATSKLLQQDEKRIAEDVGESLGRFNLTRDTRKGFDSNMYNHANEIIKHFGSPKIKDVKLLEKLTGLKSYTVPFDKQKKAFIEKLKNFENLSLNEAEELLENNSNFPNGTPINITSAKSIDKRNLTNFDFNNLFYDPATMAEYLFFNPK